jgi:hypothetical protein
MAEVPGELLVQRRLQHRLGQQLQQAVRTGQRQTLLLGLPDQLPSSLKLRGLALVASASSVAVITVPSHLPPQRAYQAGSTVRSTVSTHCLTTRESAG